VIFIIAVFILCNSRCLFVTGNRVLCYIFTRSISRCKIPRNFAAWAPSIWVWWNWNEIGNVLLNQLFLYLPHITVDLYHQHYATLSLDKHIWITTYHGIHLVRCNGLPIFANMQSLAIYHLGNLLSSHTSVLACKTVEYSFFNFHMSKIRNFSNKELATC
jgi:hypothetical protein